MERRHPRSDPARATRAARFAAQLAETLYALDLTHQALGEALSLPRYTVDSWTRGADPSIPAAVTLARLCTLLEARRPGAGADVAAAAGRPWPAPALLAGAAAAPAAGPPAPPPTAAGAPRSNLPLALTSFVGREAEVAAIREHLLRGARLLTLTGAGGIGKTRLALEIAAGLAAAFADGVWLVELAAVTGAEFVPQALARVLGVREQVGEPLPIALAGAIGAHQVLLVLDNCEHLVDACAALVAGLLAQCARLAVLVTSREVLRIAGEVTWRVPPLAWPAPDPDGLAPLPALRDYAAIRLFEQRARLAQPGFTLAAENAAAVVQLCRRLDGVPLALELAAARLRVLPVGQIAAHLDDRFALLTGGSRAVLPRHQTLWATVDWSYDLLTPPERALFSRLAVFAGSWTLEAATAVCTGAEIPAERVLELLSGLVDKSLVLVEAEEPEACYRFLETIRAYARTKLADETSGARLAAYFADYVEQHASDYALLERELSNILAALQIAFDRGLGTLLVRTMNAFYHFLETRGLYGLAEAQLARAAAAAQALGDPLGEASALLHLGRSAERRGAYAEAEARYGAGLALARAGGHAERISALLQNLGGVIIRRGDYAAAAAVLHEGLALARAGDHAERISALLGNLGAIACYQGAYLEATAYYQESLALAQQVGHRERQAALFQGLGVAAAGQGDFGRAEAAYREGLALARAIGHRERSSHLLVNLGGVLLTRGDCAGAASLLHEGLALAHAIANRERISHLLETLGEQARLCGDPAQAEAALWEGLALARALGHRERISGLLRNLGALAGTQGNTVLAEAYLQESLDLARALGHPHLISTILLDRGAIELARGQAAAAADAYGEARDLARRLGSRDLLALALFGLAHCAALADDLPAARRQGQESQALLRAMGHRQAADVTAWVAALPMDRTGLTGVARHRE